MSRLGISKGAVLALWGFALAAVVFAVTAQSSADSGPKERTRDSGSGCSLGWSVCSPDARWLREVLKKAAHGVIGQTGSALVIPYGGAVYVWATRWHGRPDPRPSDQFAPYEPLPSVAGTHIYADSGDVRLYWWVQGRIVWVEPPPERRFLARLVRLTHAVPAPAE